MTARRAALVAACVVVAIAALWVWCVAAMLGVRPDSWQPDLADPEPEPAWRDAAGALGPWDGERAEDTIRRIRGGDR